jgi:hypothetical protein
LVASKKKIDKTVRTIKQPFYSSMQKGTATNEKNIRKNLWSMAVIDNLNLMCKTQKTSQVACCQNSASL